MLVVDGCRMMQPGPFLCILVEESTPIAQAAKLGIVHDECIMSPPLSSNKANSYVTFLFKIIL